MAVEEGNWTKLGVLIGAAALIIGYLGVAAGVKWWPLEHASIGGTPTALSSPTLPPSPTPSPSPTLPPSPTAPATEADQTLISQLNSQYFNTSDCRGQSDQQSNINALAAVNCQAYQENGNSPVEDPLIIQFANGSALGQWFDANTSGFPQNSGCNRNGYIGVWHNSSPGNQGQLGCAEVDFGTKFRIVWTLTSANIGAIADGSSDNALWSWWTTAGSVTSNG
jgi:hypothetical protein